MRTSVAKDMNEDEMIRMNEDEMIVILYFIQIDSKL